MPMREQVAFLALIMAGAAMVHIRVTRAASIRGCPACPKGRRRATFGLAPDGGRAGIVRVAVGSDWECIWAAAVDGEDGKKMRVLVVEDDKDLQRLLRTALSDAGYVVDAASDGEEGHFLGDT